MRIKQGCFASDRSLVGLDTAMKFGKLDGTAEDSLGRGTHCMLQDQRVHSTSTGKTHMAIYTVPTRAA
jgi:hypothetical protein